MSNFHIKCSLHMRRWTLYWGLACHSVMRVFIIELLADVDLIPAGKDSFSLLGLQMFYGPKVDEKSGQGNILTFFYAR